MVGRHSRSDYDKCVSCIAGQRCDTASKVLVMNRNTFNGQLNGECGFRAVVSGNIVSQKVKIAGEGTHSDASDSQEIYVRYVVFQNHSLISFSASSTMRDVASGMASFRICSDIPPIFSLSFKSASREGKSLTPISPSF